MILKVAWWIKKTWEIDKKWHKIGIACLHEIETLGPA